ncbi:MAG: glutamine-hydrolyzing GMP synthase [Spirochaetaceae bacterium]|jgi:GMP synthase (glutamine-hydrolysing)|nr:glutamine-hydrolyzing GMP synthase [Spirochaetaceae bacterium]
MILILDFGSQTSQLIARRIRDMGVYAEIIAGDSPLNTSILAGVEGIVLSGSPESVYDNGPMPDPSLYTCGLPLLGICYGLQCMTFNKGGTVKPLPQREYGAIRLHIHTEIDERSSAFLAGFDKTIPLEAIKTGTARSKAAAITITVWMSHGDTITELAPGFLEAGTSANGFPALVVHEKEPWFGVQFHPEVTHCERGAEILAAFVFGLCDCRQSWDMEHYAEHIQQSLIEKVGTNPVLLLISGGVDSTVAGALLLKSLPPEQVHLMYLDTGLMRKDETDHVTAKLSKLGAQHLTVVHSEDEFLSALAGVEDPEEKRKIIGDLFITVQERETARLGLPESYFLAQGTLYTDLIESGKGVGTKAHLIKSHHNVRTPLVAAKRAAGQLVEPLNRLYKDEVRRLGRVLGVDEETLNRHPFPGPGLAVRILGAVTKEKCALLQEVDAIFIAELKERKLYDKIWQAFAVLLPIRSVGVAGDLRHYGSVVALRAITSADGMTADVYPFDLKDLLEIATRITNTVKAVGRVTYDISSKPPATIEWE